MENIIHFLRKRLKEPLPYANIQDEDIDENLKKYITDAYQNPRYSPRICAVMLAFFEEEGQVKLPFIVRPDTNRFHAGQIAFPGGGREEEDIHLQMTAIRETREEVGMIIPDTQLIGVLSNMYVPPSNSLITPVVGFLKNRPVYITNPYEVAEVIEVSLDDLMNKNNHKLKLITHPKGAIKMPAFQIGSYEIWGATARILKELVKVLGEMNGVRSKKENR